MRPVRSILSTVAALGITATSLIGVQVATPLAAGADPVETPTLDPFDRASVLAAYETSLAEARDVPTGWTGNGSTCTKGTESAASIKATRSAVNFYRALNGLAPISMNTTYNSKALEAALMMHAAGALEHYPTETWPCYTAAGDEAAGSSNLALGATGARSIDQYMEDAGAGNEVAGHRRWILFPPASTFGTGSTSNTNALWVFGGQTSRPTTQWVAWPNAGYLPKTLVKPLFSLSNNLHPNANYSNATVSVKIGSTSLPVTIHPLETLIGDDTLTWTVTLPGSFATATTDVKLDISVSGVKTAAGANLPTYSYSSTAIAGSVPGPPTNVVATAGDAYAQVTWNAPGDDGGSAVTGYRITPFIGGVAQPSQDFDASTSTIQFATGLQNGTAYTFKVAAVNAAGVGALSASSNSVTPTGAPTAPAAPTGVSATAGNAQATVSWTAPAANGGSAITGYQVTPYIGANAQSTRSFSSTATSQAITGLTNGTAYTFRVAAVNGVGVGTLSTASSPVTPTAPASVPGAPTAASATAGNGQASVSWTAPASNGGSAITGYKVTPYIGANAQTVRTFTTTATTQAITGLTNGTAYTFRVAAVNAVGTGADSSASAAVTPTTGATAPGAPTNVTGTRGNAQVSLSWTAPASNGGSAITGYKVTPYIGANAQTVRTFTTTATTQAITGLTNGTAYTFRVAAVNAVGTGSLSSASGAITPATAPGVPTGASATAGSGAATVSWTAPASNGGSPITGYQVTPYVGASAQTTRTFAGTGTSQTVTGLTNGTAYTFKVAATNAVGTSAQSSATSAVTPTATANPYAPFASWGAMVDRIFLDMTAKAPTSAERSTWVTQLGNGSKTSGDLVAALRIGTENTTNVDPTARLYRAFLQRTPDASGLKFWVNRRRAGTWTLTKMADNFAASNEFKTKYGTLTNRQFVTRIYTDVLGRTADPSGVDYWTRQLDNKRRSRGSVMVGFSESNEYINKQVHNVDVAVAYIFLLGRAPTSGEVSIWVNGRTTGTPLAVLAKQILDSGEYATRING